jgi:hypothetical protein
MDPYSDLCRLIDSFHHRGVGQGELLRLLELLEVSNTLRPVAEKVRGIHRQMGPGFDIAQALEHWREAEAEAEAIATAEGAELEGRMVRTLHTPGAICRLLCAANKERFKDRARGVVLAERALRLAQSLLTLTDLIDCEFPDSPCFQYLESLTDTPTPAGIREALTGCFTYTDESGAEHAWQATEVTTLRGDDLSQRRKARQSLVDFQTVDEARYVEGRTVKDADHRHHLIVLALATLANAKRVATDLEGAAAAWHLVDRALHPQDWHVPPTDYLMGQVCSYRASYCRSAGNYPQAMKEGERSVGLFQRAGSVRDVERARLKLGIFLVDVGEPERAVSALSALPESVAPALVCFTLSRALCDLDRFDDARRALARLDTIEDWRNKRLVSAVELLEGDLSEDFRTAEAHYNKARAGYVALGSTTEVLVVEVSRILTAIRSGDLERAADIALGEASILVESVVDAEVCEAFRVVAAQARRAALEERAARACLVTVKRAVHRQP